MTIEHVRYNPFNRGPFPVGVCTQDLHDPKRNRTLPTEIWYPATDQFKGKDLAEETKDKYQFMDITPSQNAVRDADLRKGKFPLVVFSHGFGSHRCSSSHLGCHLASHGYIIAGPDHVGNTLMDILNYGEQIRKGSPPDFKEIGRRVFLNRPIDITFTIDCMLNNETHIPLDSIDVERIGASGHSYGGWTILMAISRDKRISVALPLASAGGTLQDSTEPNPFKDVLNLKWKQNVTSLYLASEKDSVVGIKSIRDLYIRTKEPKLMVVLNNADHFHFCSPIEYIHNNMHRQPEMIFGKSEMAKNIREQMLPFSKLCSAEEGRRFLQGLGLAHMDTYLKNKKAGVEFLSGDLITTMAENDVNVTVIAK